MPNQRSSSQTQVAIALEKELLEALDSARPPGMSRSQWIRNALADALIASGRSVSKTAVASPDRTGKGGRPKKAKPEGLVREESADYITKPKK